MMKDIGNFKDGTESIHIVFICLMTKITFYIIAQQNQGINTEKVYVYSSVIL